MGARSTFLIWCSESHLKIWPLFGVDLDPDPKWALGGLLGSPGGPEIFAEKNQSRSFLGPKLPRESIPGVGFGIRARLSELDDPAVMRQMSMVAAADERRERRKAKKVQRAAVEEKGGDDLD